MVRGSFMRILRAFRIVLAKFALLWYFGLFFFFGCVTGVLLAVMSLVAQGLDVTGLHRACFCAIQDVCASCACV